VLADAARKALGDHADRGVRHKERFDTHFAQSGEGAWSIVRMQRRENEVACESGFDGDLRRFLIARFTDQNHIRILAQEGAKDQREIEPDILVCLDLT
jgi:hypothetical protein